LTVESVRGGEGFPIVAFREIADRDRAEALCGYVLEVRSSQLPELGEDEFYPFDLIGLEARDRPGAVLGRVTDVLDSAAHAILIVSLDAGGEALAPFVRAAVPVVSVEEGYLVVDPGFISIEPARAAPRGSEVPEGEEISERGDLGV
jgi:16S rRNA processing protein RimM